MRVCAIVVAGGSARRFGEIGGKQLAPVGSGTVLGYTLRAFDRAQTVDHIVVVCHPDRTTEYERLAVTPSVTNKPFVVVAGGKTRQASVHNGIDAAPSDCDVIVVHDGARPLVTPAVIDGAVEALDTRPHVAGIVVGHPSYDTLKVVRDARVVETPDRDAFWVAQTPQVFRADVLRAAYLAADAAGRTGTDDASVVEMAGHEVHMYEGPRDNIKVTVAEDIAFVETVLELRGEAGL
jgi:2-C-methyl-D-erythritol 4-phosphate cytidylyltransferase